MAYKIAQYKYTGSVTNYIMNFDTNLQLDTWKEITLNDNSGIIYNYDINNDGQNESLDFFATLNYDNLLSNTDNYFLQLQCSITAQNNGSFLIQLVNANNPEDNIAVLQGITDSNEIIYYPFNITINPKFSSSIKIWAGYNATIKYRLYKITNILPSSGSHKIKKIGIQGAPHLPIWINNNAIRLNKNGIYELHNNIDITSVGVFPDPNNPFFLIDYEYEEQS